MNKTKNDYNKPIVLVTGNLQSRRSRWTQTPKAVASLSIALGWREMYPSAIHDGVCKLKTRLEPVPRLTEIFSPPPNIGPLWSVKGWWTRNVSEIIRIRSELDRSIRNFFFSVSPFPRDCVSLKNGGLINSWICPWAMEENPGHSLSCIIWINCRFGYPRGSSWFRFCTLNVIHIHRNEMWYAQFQLLKLLKPFRKKNLIGLSLMTFILRGSMTSHDGIHTRTV